MDDDKRGPGRLKLGPRSSEAHEFVVFRVGQDKCALCGMTRAAHPPSRRRYSIRRREVAAVTADATASTDKPTSKTNESKKRTGANDTWVDRRWLQ